MKATILKTVLPLFFASVAPLLAHAQGASQNDPARPTVATADGSQVASAQRATDTPSFRLVRISDGLLGDQKTWWKGYDLVASSGNHILVRTARFEDDSQAVAHFEKTQSGAVKVIQPNATTCLDTAPKTALIAIYLKNTRQLADNEKSAEPLHYKYLHTANVGYWEISGANLDEVKALSKILEEHGVAIIWTWSHNAAPR